MTAWTRCYDLIVNLPIVHVNSSSNKLWCYDGTNNLPQRTNDLEMLRSVDRVGKSSVSLRCILKLFCHGISSFQKHFKRVATID